MDYYESMIQKIMNQIKKGKVEYNGYLVLHINFATKKQGKVDILDSDVPVIDIPDYDLFVKKVKSYLSKAYDFYKNDMSFFTLDQDEFFEKLFVDLLINATYYDTQNIYNYIDFRKEMLDNTFAEGEFDIGYFGDYVVEAKIVKNLSNLESPYRFEVGFFNKDQGWFKLPRIAFGAIDDKIYLYAVQTSKFKQTSEATKKLDRYFRKIGKGVDEQTIESNVSPNALVSLAIFNSFMRKNGYKKVIAPDYLPIRYEINKHAKINNSLPESVEEALENHDRDQFNMTNKLMYLFLRYNLHFDKANAQYDEDKGTMSIELKSQNGKGNIIYELDEFVEVGDYQELEERVKNRIYS